MNLQIVTHWTLIYLVIVKKIQLMNFMLLDCHALTTTTLNNMMKLLKVITNHMKLKKNSLEQYNRQHNHQNQRQGQHHKPSSTLTTSRKRTFCAQKNLPNTHDITNQQDNALQSHQDSLNYVDNVHNDADDSNQILLKQGTIINAQGEKPIVNAVVNNDVKKSNNKNIYRLMLHTKSTTIASYHREGTNDANNKDNKINDDQNEDKV